MLKGIRKRGRRVSESFCRKWSGRRSRKWKRFKFVITICNFTAPTSTFSTDVRCVIKLTEKHKFETPLSAVASGGKTVTWAGDDASFHFFAHLRRKKSGKGFAKRSVKFEVSEGDGRRRRRAKTDLAKLIDGEMTAVVTRTLELKLRGGGALSCDVTVSPYVTWKSNWMRERIETSTSYLPPRPCNFVRVNAKLIAKEDEGGHSPMEELWSSSSCDGVFCMSNIEIGSHRDCSSSVSDKALAAIKHLYVNNSEESLVSEDETLSFSPSESEQSSSDESSEESLYQ